MKQSLWPRLEELHPENGLPEDVFEMISTLMPVPNVDLLILNQQGRILLSWRDDCFFGTGWHIPGGCIRFRETMAERVKATAYDELGTEVTILQSSIAVRDVIVRGVRPGLENQNVRAHHIAVLFLCELPQDYDILLQKKSEGESGFLKWFDKIPENILSVHNVYNDIFLKYGLL